MSWVSSKTSKTSMWCFLLQRNLNRENWRQRSSGTENRERLNLVFVTTLDRYGLTDNRDSNIFMIAGGIPWFSHNCSLVTASQCDTSSAVKLVSISLSGKTFWIASWSLGILVTPPKTTTLLILARVRPALINKAWMGLMHHSLCTELRWALMWLRFLHQNLSSLVVWEDLQC